MHRLRDFAAHVMRGWLRDLGLAINGSINSLRLISHGLRYAVALADEHRQAGKPPHPTGHTTVCQAFHSCPKG